MRFKVDRHSNPGKRGCLTDLGSDERIPGKGDSMKAKIRLSLVVILAFLAVSGPTFAHHGTAAYDTKNIFTVKGTMTDFRFINPHVQLYFDVKNEKGEAEKWQAELTAPNKLARAGWDKYTLKPGDSITASGYVGKNDPHTMWINKLIGPDGTSLHLFEE
jgi:hypothetical protein